MLKVLSLTCCQNKCCVIKCFLMLPPDIKTVVVCQKRPILSLLTKMYRNNKFQKNEREVAVEWDGKFSTCAECILQQHVAQSGMTEAEEALAQWIEFATVNQTHAVNCQVFSKLLKTLALPMRGGLLTNQEEQIFWDGAKKVLPSCLRTVKGIRELTPEDETTKSLLNNNLSILGVLSTITPPPGTNLFFLSEYDWLTNENCDIKGALEDTITQAAIEWLFSHSTLKDTEESDKTEKSQLLRQRKIIELVKTDVQNAILYYDSIFLKIFQVPYSTRLYSVFQQKVSEMAEPLVKDICASLKSFKHEEKTEEGTVATEDDPQALGKSLFGFYMDLKRFASLGSAICPTEADVFQISEFHAWFSPGVPHWLNIAADKAMQQVKKAVELDKLVPVTTGLTANYSSSAIDIAHLGFGELDIFWQQLSWPDAEESYSFVTRILDDMCRCSVLYADTMEQKLDKREQEQNGSNEYFKVTKEWCLAVNSIDYVQNYIKPFINNKLNLGNIISKLAEVKNPSAAENCKLTVEMFMENAVDTLKNKTLELLDNVVRKMMINIKRILIGANEKDQVDRLLQYLDENFIIMSSQLSEEHFTHMLTSTFDHLIKFMLRLVEDGIEEKKPHNFFANLQQMLRNLIEFFQHGVQQSETLSRTQRLLAVNSMDTSDLIMQVHLGRLKEQQAMDKGPLGMLTIRLQLVQDTLRIEVMNAQKLKPMDSNGSSDPYVNIYLLPEEKFLQVPTMRTKTQKKNLYPLFDENFSIQLTLEQRMAKDTMLLFVLQDEDCFGVTRSDFLGEAYFSLADVASTSTEMSIKQMPQIHLHLSEPSDLGTDEMKALYSRQGDKLAREFVKTQRFKKDCHNK